MRRKIGKIVIGHPDKDAVMHHFFFNFEKKEITIGQFGKVVQERFTECNCYHGVPTNMFIVSLFMQLPND